MTAAVTLARPLDGFRRAALRARGRGLALWHRHPRGSLGLLGLVSLSAAASTLVTPGSQPQAQVAPPAPPPLIMKQIAPEQALKVNAEIPVAQPNTAPARILPQRRFP